MHRKAVVVALLIVACGKRDASDPAASASPAPVSPTAGASPTSAVALPADFPARFPIYPGAAVVRIDHGTRAGKPESTVVFSTADATARVTAFYAPTRLAAFNLNGGDTSATSPLWMTDGPDHVDLRLAVVAADGATRIEVTVTTL